MAIGSLPDGLPYRKPSKRPQAVSRLALVVLYCFLFFSLSLSLSLSLRLFHTQSCMRNTRWAIYGARLNLDLLRPKNREIERNKETQPQKKKTDTTPDNLRHLFDKVCFLSLFLSPYCCCSVGGDNIESDCVYINACRFVFYCSSPMAFPGSVFPQFTHSSLGASTIPPRVIIWK